MKLSNTYTDHYSVSTSSYEEFKNLLKDMQTESSEKMVEFSEMKFNQIVEEPNEKDYGSLIDAAKDTYANGCGIFATVSGDKIPLRESAEESLQSMFHIIGTRNLPQEKRASHYSDFFACGGAEGEKKCTVVLQSGKINTIRTTQYANLSPAQLLVETEVFVQDELPFSNFLSGNYTHSVQSWLYDLNGYAEELQTVLKGTVLESFAPALRISNSTVGTGCVSVEPILYGKGRVVPMNHPVNVVHRGRKERAIQSFNAGLKMAESRFTDCAKDIERLEKTSLNNPVNALRRVACELKLPKKNIVPCIDNFEVQTNYMREVNALDAYGALSEALLSFCAENADTIAQFKLEDSIGRAMTLNWKDYDLPGNFSY